MARARCAAVLRGEPRSRAAFLAGALVLGGCSAILDPDRDALGGTPPPDIEPVPDGGGDGDITPGDGDGDGDAGPGQGCDSCDDGVACTLDSCEGEQCTHELRDDACADGERCHVTKGCIPLRCRDATDCNDGDPCNGTESCNPGNGNADAVTGCVVGREPDCDDRIDCTADSCAAGVGCVHEGNDALCSDGVECTEDRCDAESGCENEPSDARCDACFTGATCSPVLDCLGGFTRSCSDGDPCTADSCSVELAMCVYEPSGSNDPSCGTRPDACADAEEIALDDSGFGEVSGSLAGLEADYDTACGSQPGARDAVYVITVDQVSDIVLDSEDSDADVVLAVARSSCSAQGFSFACAASVGPSDDTSRLVLHRYDPAVQGQKLYILVDGQTPSEQGDYHMHVSVKPVSDGDCGEPFELPGCGTVLGFMDSRSPANNWGTLRGDCQSGGAAERAPEAVLLVPGAADGSLRLTAVSDAFVPALYARTFCESEDNDDQLGCELGGASSADFTIALDEDQQAFVVIDGGEDAAKFLFRCEP